MITDNPYEAFSFTEWWETLRPSFISFYFIVFVFLLAVIYYLVPKKGRWIVLLLGSIVFYCIVGVEALATVLLTSSIVWSAGICIELTEKANKKKRKLYLFSGIIIVLGMLVFVKLYSLFEWNFNYLVPLGISYYTFSSIGYLADVYWGKENAERNFFKLALFLLFFPKILEGPIARHKNLAPQLNDGNDFEYTQFCFGMQLAVWGYFKKLVIADRLSVVVRTAYGDYENYGGALLFVILMLSAVQLYCDFSGCMDIAAGISQMFGIALDRNFDRPFFSKSAAEFWRRWHITLGTWFKDYVYMPIVVSPKMIKINGWFRDHVGKRTGKVVMTVLPLAVVWILTGLWHGTGMNYLLWGMYWGSIIIFSTVFDKQIRKLTTALHINTASPNWHMVQMVRTFLLFCMGRLISMPNNLEATRRVLIKFFTDISPWQLFDETIYQLGLDRKDFQIAIVSIAVLWIAEILQSKYSLRESIAKWNVVLRAAFYSMSFLFVLVVGYWGPAYDAASFVYMNF